MSNLHRGHSIDESYQVSVVATFVNRTGRGFRGEDFKKSANQKQELPVAAMFGNGS
jgi:hypothetical protein